MKERFLARRTRLTAHTGALPALLVLLASGALLVTMPSPVVAQEETNVDQLVEGQDLYLENCSGCHQPAGVGLPPQFPPLLDNPDVDDADYVADVVMNGLSGQIEANGQTYDGVMPSFPTLDETQIEAIVAYLQNDLVVPGAGDGGEGVPELAGPTAGTELPPAASALTQFGYLIIAAVVVGVLAPRVIAVVGNRGEMSAVDAGLKAGAIVVYFVVTTVFIPSAVVQSEVISRLPEGVQVFVATAIWLGALAIGILGLWWAQREDRI